jgi:hypothetical protein
MIVVLLSQTCLLFSSLRNDCCSPLSELQSSQREENNNHVRERRTTIMSERGEQQSFLRENNNHVREENNNLIVVLSQTGLLFSSLRYDCCSPLSDMIVVLLSQT